LLHYENKTSECIENKEICFIIILVNFLHVSGAFLATEGARNTQEDYSDYNIIHIFTYIRWVSQGKPWFKNSIPAPIIVLVSIVILKFASALKFESSLRPEECANLYF